MLPTDVTSPFVHCFQEAGSYIASRMSVLHAYFSCTHMHYYVHPRTYAYVCAKALLITLLIMLPTDVGSLSDREKTGIYTPTARRVSTLVLFMLQVVVSCVHIEWGNICYEA